MTQDQKNKISRTRKERFKTGDIPHSFKGSRHSDKTREKMRESWVKRKNGGYEPWNKGHTKDTHPGLIQSGITQSLTKKTMNIVAWNKGRTKETDPSVATYALKHSIFMKEYSNRPEVRERLRIQAVEHRGKYPKTNTSIEIKLQELLRLKDISFKVDEPLLRVTRVDIFIEPNICVYADGDYWHSLPGKQEKDNDINKILIEHGYKVLRFLGSDIRKDPTKCISRILEAIKKGKR